MEDRVEWHRHPFTLIRNVWAILLQPLVLLVAVLVLPRPLNLPADVVATLVMLVCCLWTILDVHARWTAIRTPTPTPTQTRRALLARMSRPWRAIMIGGTFLFILFIFAYVLFIGPRLVRPLVGRSYRWVAVALYYTLLLLGWVGLEYVDWRNEQYILTPESIIDVARVPLFYSQRTEVPLARIQDVAASHTFLGGLFGYGRVVVQTAGGVQAVIFEDVPFPERIQQIIFQYIDRWSEQERQKTRGEWGEQILRWMEGYHDVTSRVACHSYATEVPAGRPARILWRVSFPEEVEYLTYLDWGTESHAEDDAYPNHTPPVAGAGSSWYRETLFIEKPCNVYFKARASVSRNGNELYSTTEQFYTVTPEPTQTELPEAQGERVG